MSSHPEWLLGSSLIPKLHGYHLLGALTNSSLHPVFSKLYKGNLFLAFTAPDSYGKVIATLLFCHTHFPKRWQEIWVWPG